MSMEDYLNIDPLSPTLETDLDLTSDEIEDLELNEAENQYEAEKSEK